MQRFVSLTGASVSYDRYGAGPPLVLVHGAFSDHVTNWELVRPQLEREFTVYAVARRGRGETDATVGHSLEDESEDIAALIRSIGAPASVLGHSYGAHVALAAAAKVPDRVAKLVLYEAPWPSLIASEALTPLEALAHAEQWELFALTFFHERLAVPLHELEALRQTPFWAPIIEDAPATIHDLRALSRYDFDVERFRPIAAPTMLQIGAESPRGFYVTDALAHTLPDARIEALPGQAHEGMTTAPDMYAERVLRFLRS
jgi:pimeloyl-ACP methyl ester carboxylesterase